MSFIERPLFLGLVWWLVTGSPVPALPLAVFFELFWVDLIPVGGYIPPMPSFPYLLLLSLADVFGWHDPASLALPLLLCCALAQLVPYLEHRQRTLQRDAYAALSEHIASEQGAEPLPAGIVTRSFAQIVFMGFVFFSIAWIGLYGFFSLDMVQQMLAILRVSINWPVLFAIAAIGSLLALRIKPAYGVFLFSSVVIGVILFW